MRKYFILLSLSWLLLSGNFIYLGAKGNYKGSSSDSGTRIDFYDNKNMPSGWYDRGTNTYFNSNNVPSFGGYRMDNEDD